MDSITNQPFSTEQKEYLAGFAAGLATKGLFPFVGHRPDGAITHRPGEAGANLAAPTEDAAVTAFGLPLDELCREERLKLEQNPLDIWDKILRVAAEDKPPEGGDVFRFKFHGLFYVAPTQESFMLRLRTPAGVLTAAQMRGLARIARDWGGGYSDVTTRANIQIREFAPRNVVNVLMGLAELGLSSRGSGADNIRNITATPTTGLDPTELIDVQPLARALQLYLYNSRDLYGIPRKFNIAFDSGGAVSVVSDTNDIGFVACRVGSDAAREAGIEPGVYFRVLLAGITGHLRFAEDAGLLLKADECVAVAAAMVRAFNETGDRTDRKKARLCYVIARLGIEGFLEKTQARLAFPLRRLPAAAVEPRPPVVRHGHLGVHAQAQPGLNYVGVAIPVGRMSWQQMEALAALAERCGSGELRLTVWQNILLPNVPDDRIEELRAGLRDIGFAAQASNAVGGLVACTGNTGCRFAATDTKGHAIAIARHLDASLALDQPVNIHLTGCPNSCAQHYIGDIGLLGVQVESGSGLIEAYNVYVGGGCDQERGLARELLKGVPAAEVAPHLERLFKAYLARRGDGEGFLTFARRLDIAELRTMAEA